MVQVKALEPADFEQTLDDEKREVFEQIIAKYENDWHKDRSTQWQDYLPEDAQLRACLIAELPEIEAEFQGRKSIRNTVLASVVHKRPAGELVASGSETTKESDSKDRSFRAEVNYQQAIREIRGGLGDVFVIRDVELNRVVVVKQLQAKWLGNRRAERAFQREVKITSMLEHPCVVPVHSVGTTADGRPFYSMRYVSGQTLQQAIDTLHKSSTFDRNLYRSLLTHFVQICKTIAYANSCGIIHRDLKPSNVVIGQFGQTLVLDWGLAKELFSKANSQDGDASDVTPCPGEKQSQDGTACESTGEDTDFFLSTDSVGSDTRRGETTMGDVVGTPAYMSPEQALGQVREYSVRTDVFGLGGVLYAILAGRPPFVGRDASETISLAAEGTADFSQIIVRDAQSRGLIAICRKAMNRESSQRYPDAQSLADDLESWLAGENIAIQSQPLLHRLGRFAMRQRTLATAAVLFLVAMIAAIIVGIKAVEAEKTHTLLAENESKANFRVAKNVAEYVAKVYRTADPIRFDDPGFAGSGSTTARTTLKSILDSGYDLINSDLSEHPEPHADLLLSMGASYRGIGEYGRARDLLKAAWQVRKDLFGEEDCRTLECKYQFSRLEYEQGNYDTAERMLRELIGTILRIRTSAAKPYDSQLNRNIELLAANVRYQLAWLQFFQPLGLNLPQFKPEKVAESQRLFNEVIQLRKSVLPKNDRSIGMAYAGLAAALFCSPGKENDAMYAAASAMEILGHTDQENSFGSFLIEYNKAENYRKAGKYDEAERQYLKLASFISDQVGESHPLIAIHRWNMAGFYRKFGQMDKAEAMVLAVRRGAKNIPAVRSSPVHLDGLKQYAEALVEHNRRPEAAEIYLEILRFARERASQHGELIKLVQQQLDQLDLPQDQ